MSRDLSVFSHLRKSPLFEPANSIVLKLRNAGYPTFFAGGAVRDALLGRALKDLDIATAARPDEVTKVFGTVVDIGSEFGVLGVKAGGHLFEVTSFRSESDYKDGRRPETVVYADIETDAVRRDFTINALYLDPTTGEVLDYVQGFADLQNQILRTVGDPEARFEEDHLRILRALRFSSTLGFTIEPKTLAAMRRWSQQISRVAKERVTQEIEKLLLGDFVVKTIECGGDILAGVFGFEVPKTAMKLLLLTPKDLSLRLASLLLWNRDVLPVFFQRMRFARSLVRQVESLLKGCDDLQNPALRWGQRLEILGSLDGLRAFDLLTSANAVAGITPPNLVALHDAYLRVAAANGELPRPFITAQTLLNYGLKGGAQFGRLLKEAYWLQLEEKIQSTEASEVWLRKELGSLGSFGKQP